MFAAARYLHKKVGNSFTEAFNYCKELLFTVPSFVQSKEEIGANYAKEEILPRLLLFNLLSIVIALVLAYFLKELTWMKLVSQGILFATSLVGTMFAAANFLVFKTDADMLISLSVVFALTASGFAHFLSFVPGWSFSSLFGLLFSGFMLGQLLKQFLIWALDESLLTVFRIASTSLLVSVISAPGLELSFVQASTYALYANIGVFFVSGLFLCNFMFIITDPDPAKTKSRFYAGTLEDFSAEITKYCYSTYIARFFKILFLMPMLNFPRLRWLRLPVVCCYGTAVLAVTMPWLPFNWWAIGSAGALLATGINVLESFSHFDVASKTGDEKIDNLADASSNTLSSTKRISILETARHTSLGKESVKEELGSAKKSRKANLFLGISDEELNPSLTPLNSPTSQTSSPRGLSKGKSIRNMLSFSSSSSKDTKSSPPDLVNDPKKVSPLTSPLLVHEAMLSKRSQSEGSGKDGSISKHMRENKERELGSVLEEGEFFADADSPSRWDFLKLNKTKIVKKK